MPAHAFLLCFNALCLLLRSLKFTADAAESVSLFLRCQFAGVFCVTKCMHSWGGPNLIYTLQWNLLTELV